MLVSILKGAVPHITLSALVILMHAPSIASSHILLPNATLLCVFFFELFKNSRISKVFLIVLGLFNDYISWNLIGLTSLQFVILTSIVSKNYKALNNQKFIIIWLTFICDISIIYLIKFIALSIYHRTLMFNINELWELMLTISSYPILHLLLFRVLQHKVLLSNHER